MALLPLLAASLIGQTTSTAAAAAQDSVKLSRTYKEGDKDSYTLRVNAGDANDTRLVEAVIASAVEKVLPSGHATVKLEAQNSGSDGGELPEAMEGEFDEHGMSNAYTFEHNGWVYFLVSSAGYIPTGDLSVGKDVKVDWATKDNSFSMKGTGHLEKLDTVDGQKVAILSEKVTVNISGQDGAAEVTNKATVLVDSGRLLKAEGSVEIGGQQHMEFKVEQKKK